MRDSAYYECIMSDPLISVIVPIYNSEKTIVRCVESIIFQPFKNIEIILVEDASSDRSKQICYELERQYNNIVVVEHNRNKGVSAARNDGLCRASGDYVVFIDSDDWIGTDYFSDLLDVIEKKNIGMGVCGFWYSNEYEQINNQVHIFDKMDSFDVKESDDIFQLVDKWHFGALWNKIFVREIIEKYHIRFDEYLSIGEDTRFSLEYLKKMGGLKIGILSRPHYHYVQSNSNSLWMLHQDKIEKKLETNDMVYSFLSEEKKRQYEWNYQKKIWEAYENQFCLLGRMKGNYIQKLKELKLLSGAERYKESCRKTGMCSEKKAGWYLRWMYSWSREKYLDKKRFFISFITRLLGVIRRKCREPIIKRQVKICKVKECSLISQNCIGGVFYHDMGLQFMSPTINLFFKPEDFCRFVNNLKYYVTKPLEVYWGEQYPMGKIEDISIHFMHYESCREAKEKWEERCSRIDWDRIIVLSTDMEGFNENHFRIFEKIPYPKILFTGKKIFSEAPFALYYPEYHDREVKDLIPGRKFYKNSRLVHLVNEERKRKEG